MPEHFKVLIKKLWKPRIKFKNSFPIICVFRIWRLLKRAEHTHLPPHKLCISVLRSHCDGHHKILRFVYISGSKSSWFYHLQVAVATSMCILLCFILFALVLTSVTLLTAKRPPWQVSCSSGRLVHLLGLLLPPEQVLVLFSLGQLVSWCGQQSSKIKPGWSYYIVLTSVDTGKKMIRNFFEACRMNCFLKKRAPV